MGPAGCVFGRRGTLAHGPGVVTAYSYGLGLGSYAFTALFTAFVGVSHPAALVSGWPDGLMEIVQNIVTHSR